MHSVQDVVSPTLSYLSNVHVSACGEYDTLSLHELVEAGKRPHDWTLAEEEVLVLLKKATLETRIIIHEEARLRTSTVQTIRECLLKG